MNIDFGELKNDESFKSKVKNVAESIAEIEKLVEEASKVDYEKLTIEDKVKFDLFMVYAVNSLYWMYLRINGENPNTHGIKHELSRVKDAMERQKQIHDHKTIRPVLQQDAAKRMVRSGLYDVQKKNEVIKNKRQLNDYTKKIHIHSNPNPLNRKRKFEDN
ncbi:CLUMA_CG010043, isoform A [Clunio marinus]|uniref:Nuclear nucleic acid-binding protein C1D n=1 Tax=Clunio marinus TaxID=568069 RepID=A0A1J1IDS1_9DIPT|nr:CLUMA_CG010043, isoform A [Clunio marinus]